MNEKEIRKMLKEYKKGKRKEGEVIRTLKCAPFEDLGFAKVDQHRELRNGCPEVVFCHGKTIGQIEGVFVSLKKSGCNVMLTKADGKIYERLKKIDARTKYDGNAGMITLENKKIKKTGNVLVICAGTADIPVAEEAAITAEFNGAKVERVYDAGVAGLHRLLANKDKIFRARSIVAVAGMDGALPSVVGGLASCPVIAVPTSVGYGANFRGIAPLLTMMNSCSPNVSVVNIDNGFGAGYISAMINRKR